MSVCILFITNKNYFFHFSYSYWCLRTFGKYKGPVHVIIGDDLIGYQGIEDLKDENIIFKHFPDLIFTDEMKNELSVYAPKDIVNSYFRKIFRYHKYYMFDVFFKQWDYVLYIDCGMRICKDINLIINEKKDDKIVANQENIEICKQMFSFDKYFLPLWNKYDFKLKNLFNTSLLLFNTNTFIKENTVQELIKFTYKYYPAFKCHDQGAFNLYFLYDFELLNRKLFDFWKRDDCVAYKYIYGIHDVL